MPGGDLDQAIAHDLADALEQVEHGRSSLTREVELAAIHIRRGANDAVRASREDLNDGGAEIIWDLRATTALERECERLTKRGVRHEKIERARQAVGRREPENRQLVNMLIARMGERVSHEARVACEHMTLTALTLDYLSAA